MREIILPDSGVREKITPHKIPVVLVVDKGLLHLPFEVTVFVSDTFDLSDVF